jgi:hypothetical protein
VRFTSKYFEILYFMVIATFMLVVGMLLGYAITLF